MCVVQTKWGRGVVAEGSGKPCQMIQHGCFGNGETTDKSTHRASFSKCLMCKHESSPSGSWYKSVLSLMEEILKRRRIFSLQFLS